MGKFGGFMCLVSFRSWDFLCEPSCILCTFVFNSFLQGQTESLSYYPVTYHLKPTTFPKMCKFRAPLETRTPIPATRPPECQIEIIRMLNYIGVTRKVTAFLGH